MISADTGKRPFKTYVHLLKGHSCRILDSRRRGGNPRAGDVDVSNWGLAPPPVTALTELRLSFNHRAWETSSAKDRFTLLRD